MRGRQLHRFMVLKRNEKESFEVISSHLKIWVSYIFLGPSQCANFLPAF